MAQAMTDMKEMLASGQALQATAGAGASHTSQAEENVQAISSARTNARKRKLRGDLQDELGWDDRESGALTIPRFGEFTLQDILRQGQAISKYAASGLTTLATKAPPGGLLERGIFKAADLTERAGGLAGASANLAVPVYEQVRRSIGMPQNYLNPFTITRAAGSYGADTGTNLFGAFRVPFGGEGGFLSQGLQEEVGSRVQALKSLFEPGVSFAGTSEAQAALRESGIAPTQQSYDDIIDVYKRLGKGPYGEEGIPSNFIAETTRMMRMGETSPERVEDLFTGMADVAESAKMSLDDFSTSLFQAADELEGFGLSLTQGAETTKRFSAVTDLHPGALPELLNNPLIQGQAQARTGLLPQQLGLYAQQNLPGFLGDVQSGLGIYDQALGGAFETIPGAKMFGGQLPGISGKEQKLAMMSSYTGLDKNVIKWLQSGEYEASAKAAQTVDAFQRKEANIRTRFAEGKIGSEEERDRLIEDLYSSQGKFEDMPEIDKMIPRLTKAGVLSPKVAAHIGGEDLTRRLTRGELIEKIAAPEGDTRTREDMEGQGIRKILAESHGLEGKFSLSELEDELGGKIDRQTGIITYEGEDWDNQRKAREIEKIIEQAEPQMKGEYGPGSNITIKFKPPFDKILKATFEENGKELTDSDRARQGDSSANNRYRGLVKHSRDKLYNR